MTLEDIKKHLLDHIKDVNKSNYIPRCDPNDEKAPFFALIRPEEQTSGAYSDLSYVIFPDDAGDVKKCLVTICVGSNGFRYDYDNARLPWWRREFMTLDGAICKVKYSNIESTLDGVFQDFPEVKKKYGKWIVAAREVEIPDQLAELEQWLATYAYVREWPKAPERSIPQPAPMPDVATLLKSDKYVVLQGAPGVGKTFTATKVAQAYGQHVHFIQFHAETTYADFVEGIEPTLGQTATPGFVRKEGVLLQAIKDALGNPEEEVLLIIDEINRANLSNVLGPVFYLFEKGATGRNVGIDINGQKLTKLPDNLHVLGTMNTADRSLAVVDFALRRRFIWVTLKPEPIAVKGKTFKNYPFEKMSQIFRRYADDAELALQPGQSYFLVDKAADFTSRARYELLPLIKEYLNEGFLRDAESAFVSYFAEFAPGALLYE